MIEKELRLYKPIRPKQEELRLYRPKREQQEELRLYRPEREQQEELRLYRPEQIVVYQGINPYISIDPKTGMRVEVATSVQDIENREKYARRYGVPVEKVTAPPPEGTSDQEREKRIKLMQKF